MTLEQYRQTLLQSEARIIAEDDDHIVVSLRLNKDAIRSNLRLLAAVFDAVDRRR